jgi:hypothetical protein
MKKLFNYIKNLFTSKNEIDSVELVTPAVNLSENLNQVTLINEVKEKSTDEKPKKKKYYKRKTNTINGNSDTIEKPKSTSKKSKNID